METNNFALHNGNIVYVPDVPEPDVENLSNSEAHAKYKLDLQSAIASGIEVEDQDEVMRHIFRTNEKDQYVLEGKLYPLQCRVEVRERRIHVDHSQKGSTFRNDEWVKVARVTFEQPEDKVSERIPDNGKRLPIDSRESTGFFPKPEAAGQEQEKQAYKFRREQFEIQKNVHYWAGRLIGHHQAYEIAEEIVDAINYAIIRKP